MLHESIDLLFEAITDAERGPCVGLKLTDRSSSYKQMDKVFDHIRESALNLQDVKTSEMTQCRSPCVFYRQPLQGCEFRLQGSRIGHCCGDLVVGFIANEDVSFVLHVHGREVCKHVLMKGQFVFAIDDMFIIPYVCLAFHEVRVIVSNEHLLSNVDVLYGMINQDERRFLARNKWYSKRSNGAFVCYKSGMMEFCDTVNNDFLEIPPSRTNSESTTQFDQLTVEQIAAVDAVLLSGSECSCCWSDSD